MKCACVVLTLVALSMGASAQTPSQPPISQVFAFFCNEDFSSCPDGFDPTLVPIQSPDSSLNVVTWWAGQGSSNNGGTVTNVTLAGRATVLHTFVQAPNGSYPLGENPVIAFAKGPDGALYGVTESGGTHSSGVMYRLGTQGVGSFQVLYNFCSLPGCPDGPGPLTLARDGNFYGAEFHTIYRITPKGSWSLLHALNPTTEGIAGSLIQASDGNFYGAGRVGNQSDIFRVTPAGVFTILYRFPQWFPGVTSNLVQASDGNLYGATSGSGSGTGIFRISLTGQFEFIHEMTDSEGYSPGQLLQASDGNLWGLSSFRNGSFFSISLSGVSLTSGPFTCNLTGCEPQGMVEGADGNFYGTAIMGGLAPGKNAEGTVFKIAANLGH
jgi:uncharacterized repeat protein (TIGR03803 family)